MFLITNGSVLILLPCDIPKKYLRVFEVFNTKTITIPEFDGNGQKMVRLLF